MRHQADQGDRAPGAATPTPDAATLAPVAAVQAGVHGRSLPVAPRTMVVALAIVAAFVAGSQLGPAPATGPITAVVTPTASGSAAPSPRAAPTVIAGESRFLNTFDPASLLLAAGLTCSSSGVGGGVGGGRAYLVDTERCNAAPAVQAGLIRRLASSISDAIQRTALSRGGGFSLARDPEVPVIMSWDYRSGGFDGSVHLVATRTGPGLQVVLILSEQVRA